MMIDVSSSQERIVPDGQIEKQE